MQDIVRVRCGRSGLVRFETVIKAGIGYKMFYCGRCEYTWKSPDITHATESLEQLEDEAKRSRPTKNDE